MRCETLRCSFFCVSVRAFNSVKWLLALFVLSSCSPSEETPSISDEAPVQAASADSQDEIRYAWRDGQLAWHSWSEHASRETLPDRPLLFYVAAPGCEGLFPMPSPLLREIVERRYVGVRVNPFVWPDAMRYLRPGGCPSLVIAHPDGRVVARATDIPPRHVESYLLRLLAAFEKGHEALDAVERPAGVSHSVRVAHVYETLLSAVDQRHGGLFGPRKYLHARALRFLWLRSGVVGDTTTQRVVEDALSAFLRSPLNDDQSGAFALYSYAPDWGHPAGERDVLNQAEVVQLLSDVGQQAPVDAWLSYVGDQLRDARTGALRGRQVQLADGSWWTDPQIYVDRLASALLVLARVAEERESPLAVSIADGALRFLVEKCVDDRGIVSHICSAEGPRGLLVDQALVALALHAWTPRSVYATAEVAQRTARFAEEFLYSDQRQQFAAGWRWPLSEDYAVDDDGYPVGNALMAEWYHVQGLSDRADKLVDAARFVDGEHGVASDWAWIEMMRQRDKSQ